jgi:hypothetical protein
LVRVICGSSGALAVLELESNMSNTDLVSEDFSIDVTVTGTFWFDPSRGRFEVAYRGRRKSDGRTGYDIGHARCMARIILREMAIDDPAMPAPALPLRRARGQ